MLCGWCQKRNDRDATLCYDCWLKAKELRAPAYIEIAAAVKGGELPNPKTLRCVDCGKRAAHYDHRLYAAPRNVEPVCRSCNRKRGSALDFLSPKLTA